MAECPMVHEGEKVPPPAVQKPCRRVRDWSLQINLRSRRSPLGRAHPTGPYGDSGPMNSLDMLASPEFSVMPRDGSRSSRISRTRFAQPACPILGGITFIPIRPARSTDTYRRTTRASTRARCGAGLTQTILANAMPIVTHFLRDTAIASEECLTLQRSDPVRSGRGQSRNSRGKWRNSNVRWQ